MTTAGDLRTALVGLVHDASGTPADALGTFLRAWGESAGLIDLTVYLIDYQQRRLAPINPLRGVATLEVDTTVAGRAFISGQQIEVSVGDNVMVWTSVADGSARLGVIGVTVAQVDDDLRQLVIDLAAIVGALLVTRGLYTDGLMMCRRTERDEPGRGDAVATAPAPRHAHPARVALRTGRAGL